MADLKISQLNSIVTVVPATDVLPVVQGGTTLKITPKQILESGSPAVLASASITGALTVDTTTLVVDATNDCVGILTATPDADRLANTGLVIGNGTTARGIMFYGTSSSQQNLAFSDTAASQQGLLQYDHSVDQMKFFTSGALQATLTTTALTIANGNVVMATSGKGIDFSAVTGGTGTATGNVLNDYEEGTWVPSISSGATAVTYGTQLGSYTKVGRLVTVVAHLSTNSATVNGSQLTITGLPFNVPNFGAGVVAYNNTGFVSTPSGNKPNLYLSGSNIDFYTSSGSAFLGTSLGDDAFDVRFTATYFV